MVAVDSAAETESGATARDRIMELAASVARQVELELLEPPEVPAALADWQEALGAQAA